MGSIKSLYRGKVTRVGEAGVYIEVPHIATGSEFGPCEVSTDSPIDIGDRVVAGLIEDTEEDFVVLAKVGNTPDPFLPTHDHDGRYFTEAESDARFASLAHLHDDRYFTETEADARFSALAHLHDDRYFTEAETTALLTGKADTAHSHVIADVTGLATALAGKSDTTHTHAAADVTSGVFAIARIPTGTTGTTVALGDHTHTKAQITDFAHVHPFTEVTGVIDNAQLPARLGTGPVAAGKITTTYNNVVEAGWYVMDSTAPDRPTNATCYLEVRTYSPSYTEQSATDVTTGASYVRYKFAGAWGAWTQTLSKLAELDARFPRSTEVLRLLGTTTWLRVATVDGGNASNGGHITLMIAGQGSYGSSLRTTDIVTLGQRNDNGYAWEATRIGSSTTPWQYYVKQISTLVFELWARRTSFDSEVTVTVLAAMGPTTALNLDSSTTVDPALTALSTPVRADLPSVPVSILSGATGPFTGSIANDNVNRIGHFVSAASVPVPAGAVTAVVTLSWHAHCTGSATAVTWIPYIRRVGIGDTSLGGRPVSNFGIAAMDLGITVTGIVDVRTLAGSGSLELHNACQNPVSSAAAVTVGTMNWSVTFMS